MSVWRSEQVIDTATQMHDLGVQLGRVLRAGDLVVLTGELGAGKTTLTRGIGEGLGVRGPVTSPTFVLARTHPSLRGGPALVHVDAYRLGGTDEFDDLDLDFERSVVIVEWGRGVVEPADDWLDIEIGRTRAGEWSGEDDDEPRTITLVGHGDRWQGGLGHG